MIIIMIYSIYNNLNSNDDNDDGDDTNNNNTYVYFPENFWRNFRYNRCLHVYTQLYKVWVVDAIFAYNSD